MPPDEDIGLHLLPGLPWSEPGFACTFRPFLWERREFLTKKTARELAGGRVFRMDLRAANRGPRQTSEAPGGPYALHPIAVHGFRVHDGALISVPRTPPAFSSRERPKALRGDCQVRRFGSEIS